MRLLVHAVLLGAAVALLVGAVRPGSAAAAVGSGGRARRLALRGALALVASVLLAGVGCSAVRGMIYFPMPDGDYAPEAGGVPVEEVSFPSEDGTRLHGWVARPAGAAPGERLPALLYLHGNAGNLTFRRENVAALRDALGVAVMIFDYRGYGRSDGSPHEAGIAADARAAFDLLAARPDVDPDRIIVLGCSLGGAVAIQLASDRRPAALILECTFTSIADMAQVVLGIPIRPIARVLPEQWRSIDKIGRLEVPLLLLHGEADQLIPIGQGERLFDAAREPKLMIRVRGAGHGELLAQGDRDAWAAFEAFVARHAGR